MKFSDIRRNRKHSLSRVLIISLSIVIQSVLYCATDCRADDLSLSDLFDSVSFDVGGGVIYQPHINIPDEGILILRPEYLSERRRLESYLQDQWYLDGDRLTDNPLLHAASYLEFAGNIRRGTELTISTSMTVEHRGFSGGTYNENMIIVYPKYMIDYHTVSDDNPFKIWDAGGQFRMSAGTFQKLRYYEGLLLYNIDFQAVYMFVQLGRFRLSHLHIGDLKYGIGLDIDDLLDYMISVESLNLGKGIMADIRFGLTDFADYTHNTGSNNGGKPVDVLNVSAGVQLTEGIRYYGQVAYRYYNGDYETKLKLAALIGGTFEGQAGRFNYSGRFEFRHYGGIFNYQLKEERSTHYRETNRYDIFNYAGDQLYPLELFDRSFSQWAVFAEYHKRFVDGVTAYAELKYYFGKSQYFYTELDINSIIAEDEDTFTYPFYKAGFGFEAGENNYIIVGMTNKTMNLDKHFPTYYCTKTQLIHFELRRMIDWTN